MADVYSLAKPSWWHLVDALQDRAEVHNEMMK